MKTKEISRSTTQACFFSIFCSGTNTVEHDFNGHEVNGIYWVNGKSAKTELHLVNKLHDFNRIHCLSGKFCHDDFFRKPHARLY